MLPSVRLLAAVTALLLQLPHHGWGLVTVDTVLAGWRHGTKRGPGPRWLIVLLKSSPTIFLYLHFRVHHRQQGDLALQEDDLVTVNLTLAVWRHSTKRGRGPRWLIELIISYFNLTLLVVSLPPCPPSPARRPGTARGGSCNSRPHSGRLASWYETGVGGSTVIHSITYKQPNHTLMMVSSCPCPPSPARRLGTTKGELCYNSPHSGRLAPWHETGAWAPLVDSITYKQPHHTLIVIVVSSPAR